MKTPLQLLEMAQFIRIKSSLWHRWSNALHNKQKKSNTKLPGARFLIRGKQYSSFLPCMWLRFRSKLRPIADHFTVIRMFFLYFFSGCTLKAHLYSVSVFSARLHFLSSVKAPHNNILPARMVHSGPH